MRWLALTLMLVGCVPAPSDPVAAGTLCLPPTAECPNSVLVSRDAVGRNQLDYTVKNLGPDESVVTAQALVPLSTLGDAGTVDAGNLADADGDVDGAAVILIASNDHVLDPGESASNRWTPQLLGTRDPIQFEITCADCMAESDFVMSSVPLECSSDDDCSSGWLCDTRIPGRCVECQTNDDCAADQTCDVDRGRCDPPAAASCATVDATASGWLILFALAWCGRRRRVARVTPLVVAMLISAGAANAEPPVASLGVGVGTHVFSGAVGDVTQPGLSLSLAQELRWQYLGVSLGITTAYFLTDQPTPPFSRDLRTAAVHGGPRGYIPVGPVEVTLGVDYARLGLDSNSLVRITGPQLSYNAFNFGVGGRYRWSGLEARLEVGRQTILDFPGDITWLQLCVAIASGQ